MMNKNKMQKTKLMDRLKAKGEGRRNKAEGRRKKEEGLRQYDEYPKYGYLY
jgi:hypothetical protein